jgi:hypothetical protein
MENTPYAHLPRQYYKSRFWRFVLDTKDSRETISEPRFRQFSENLRNYVASGAVLKAGTALFHSGHTATKIFSFLLILLGACAALLSEAQLFGLSLLAGHFYLNFSPKNELRNLLLLLILPALLLIAMLLFVTADVSIFAGSK